ncbi:tyrosine-protein kinase receptor UFO-like [Liolophura sinensis]|uniref:tyrosine-protein kinase receptor UFO-like n=1 Tax=Liolophura sinensis TaxID=3198878 RepID=UPI003158C1CE
METINITVDSDAVVVFPLLYCCMGDGQIDNEIELPTEHPFYLLLYGWKCQQVKGMDVKKQRLEYRAGGLAKHVQSSPNDLLGVTTNANKTAVTFVVCRYQRKLPCGDNYMTIILVSTIGVLGLAITLVACICRKHRVVHRTHRVLETEGSKLISISSALPKSKENVELEIGSMLKMVLDAESQMTIYEFLIHPDKIETLEEIGKENCAYPEISAFMEEAIVMAGFRHANVLTMIGVCVHPTTHIPTLVLPFMEHGDLQKYLRSFRYEDDLKDKAPELNQLLSFCLHIARGMTYLSDMKFVHRDLAARNCMLDSNMVVKVADFGLTRDVYSNSYYRQDKNKLLPVKWMAIESLRDRVFSICTDVWSYGVTVWEIFTLGKVPYPELENAQVLPELEKGQRLSKPDTCPDAVYDLVLKCWLENPKERPTFVDIAKTIEDVLAGISEYLDLDKAPARTVDISSGVICSPQDLADLEKKGTPTKMNYVDYREASFRAKGFTESRNL